MAEFNAAQVLAEAYTLYKKHHDGMGLDFKIAINQVRKESKAEALRDAADHIAENRQVIIDGDKYRACNSCVVIHYEYLTYRADQMEGDIA